MKEIVLYGRSPFIKEISDSIPILLDCLPSIGLNSFPLTYHNVTYWCFVDRCSLGFVLPNWKEQTLLTTAYNVKALRKTEKENYQYYFIEKDTIVLNSKDTLGFSGYSFTLALNWCINNGYDTVYLAGIDLYEEDGYFDCELFAPNRNTSKLLKAKEFLLYCTEFINIVQLNPKSSLGLYHRDVKDVIKGYGL